MFLKNSKTYQKLCNYGLEENIATVSGIFLITSIACLLTFFKEVDPFLTTIILVILVSGIALFIKKQKIEHTIFNDWKKLFPKYVHETIIVGLIIFWGYIIIEHYHGRKPNQ